MEANNFTDYLRQRNYSKGTIDTYNFQVTPFIESGVVTGFQFLTDNVMDVSPVRAFVGLNALLCPASDRDGHERLGDLSPLKGMPLTRLEINNTCVADLSPLQGMKLLSLSCFWANVNDLSPLMDMPLKDLNIVGNPISDLSQLTGIPLTSIDIRFTLVTDLSPLKEMPLTVLMLVFKPERDTELLRSIKTLETINHKPAAEFWKEVEEKQTTSEAWTKQVAGMSAEEQVKAVAKKLQEHNPGFDGKVTPVIENGVVT